MKDIPINNPDLIKDLTRFERFREPSCLDDMQIRGGNFTKKDQLHYTGTDYLKDIVREGTSHEGYPMFIKSYSLQHNTILMKNGHDYERTKNTLAELWDSLATLETKYCLKTNALFAVYPPGGFISWHNNANASAYNLIFTWSETGAGDFTYLDRKNRKLVRVGDRAGWQCKYGYFGGYRDNPNDLVYHSAKTDCWRMTISFVFDRSQASKKLQQWVIEDIQSST